MRKIHVKCTTRICIVDVGQHMPDLALIFWQLHCVLLAEKLIDSRAYNGYILLLEVFKLLGFCIRP